MDEAAQNRIYDSIKSLIKEYEPSFKVHEGKNVSGKDSYGLDIKGSHEVAGKVRDDLWFVGIIKQKGYVGFYFMPIYNDPETFTKLLSPKLLKTLKGKSCFYIKNDDPETLADIKHALSEGLKFCQARGWA